MYQDKNATKMGDSLRFSGLADAVPETGNKKPNFMARVNPIMKLADGNVAGHLSEFSKSFDDLPFGAMKQPSSDLPTLCNWMEIAIQKAMSSRSRHACGQGEAAELPLLIPAPDALFHLADASSACEATIGRLLEFLEDADMLRATCFVFQDSCLSATPTERSFSLQAFRNHGIRLALDWRTTWNTQFDPSLARQFDTAIIPSDALTYDPDLLVRIYEAKLAEIPIIIDGAKWRDSDELVELGVNYVTNPVCDS